MKKFEVLAGCILSPVFMDNGKQNWLAVVTSTEHGGRVYQNVPAKGMFDATNLKAGTVVEFGANGFVRKNADGSYMNGPERRERARWYGVVRSRTDKHVEIEQKKTLFEALVSGLPMPASVPAATATALVTAAAEFNPATHYVRASDGKICKKPTRRATAPVTTPAPSVQTAPVTPDANGILARIAEMQAETTRLLAALVNASVPVKTRAAKAA